MQVKNTQVVPSTPSPADQALVCLRGTGFRGFDSNSTHHPVLERNAASIYLMDKAK